MEPSIETVRELILTSKKPSYQTTNKKEVRIRCPYCGDSRRDPSAAHLYIEMKPPFRFHCFKCETSGVLNNQTLRDMEIYDSSLNSSLISLNKNFKENQGVHTVKLSKKRSIKMSTPESEQSYNAQMYLNNRYGTSLDGKFMTEKLRAVLDPGSFFKENGIIPPNGVFDFWNAIGFTSSDNSHIVFRDITGNQKRRYCNLNIAHAENDISSKMYNISSSVDIMSEKVNLVITEGIFDIIGVYLHFYKDTEMEKDTIFTAACGKGFNAVILNYIRAGFLDLNISIYSDGDVDVNFYRDMKNSSPYLKNSRITVYYNNLYNKTTGFGKDYGVPKNQIQLRKIII